MYENQTYEAILQRMLDRVPADVDKREGSIICDALAPAAVELAQMYAELDTNIRLSFGETASGEFLARRAAEFGVNRRAATFAMRRALFKDRTGEPINIPISSRFSLSGVNYKVLEKEADGQFVLIAEMAGVIGNHYFGTLLPLDYINGLAVAELTDIIVPGEDEESDESLRARYLTKARSPSAGGNKADYVNWTLEVAGVGGVSVIPVRDGPGTVSIAIIGTDSKPASSQLVADVQAHIDELKPIGADPSVEAAAALLVNVVAALTVASGYNVDSVRDAVKQAISDYIKSLAFADDNDVRYVRIGQAILDTTGVMDYTGLTVNGGTSNIVVGSQEVAVPGTVSFT